MTTAKSTSIRILGAGKKVFNETFDHYRAVVSYLIGVVNTEGNVISQFTGREQSKCVERLIHNTAGRTWTDEHGKKHVSPPNVAKYGFDRHFCKCPGYFRRSAIESAIGTVSSHKENYALWLAGGQKGRVPKLQADRNPAPAFYRGNMARNLDPQNGTIELKLRKDGDWAWTPVRLKKTDLKYMQRHFAGMEGSSPVLMRRNGHYEIRIAFGKKTTLVPPGQIFDNVIAAVDLGLNTDAACSIIANDGTVPARKFIDFPGEKDQLYKVPGRTRRIQREHGRKAARAEWKYACRLNEELADKVASAIVDFASSYGCVVIVFEHLDFRGKKRRGSKAQKLLMWRRNDIQNRVEYKAHWEGIRIRRVCAWGTSRLAFDGSGPITRNPKNHALATFTTGRQFNADLSASFNIGARYWIREILKSVPATVRSRLGANVPESGRRTSCTLAALRSVAAELRSLPEACTV